MTQDSRIALDDIATFFRRLQWAAVAFFALWVLWLLAPVLTPFAVAALLGWMGDPLADRLEARGLSRNTAVILVFAMMSTVALIGLLVLVPMIERQIVTLIESLPKYRDWLLGTLVPAIEHRLHLNISGYLDPDNLFELVRSHWSQAGDFASQVLSYVSKSGFALLAMAANVVLIPVLTFFFLRDWDLFVGRVESLVPRDHIETVHRLASESSQMLREFLRGQLLVMLVLALLYAVGLRLVGLELGILIGLLGGLFTFVPYLGPATIIVLGSIAALVQFGDWQHIAGVAVVFAVGQVIESYWLTPKLVGNRIGLHPVAVIFAVMAGGQLFGFLGMLMALPVAAVANVLLRYARERYTASKLYGGEQFHDKPVIIIDDAALPESQDGLT